MKQRKGYIVLSLILCISIEMTQLPANINAYVNPIEEVVTPYESEKTESESVGCIDRQDEECGIVTENDIDNLKSELTKGEMLTMLIDADSGVQTEAVIEYNSDGVLSNAISNAIKEINDKSTLKIIKVTGNAEKIVGSDWIELMKLFDKGSEHYAGGKNVEKLDLSEMSNLREIGNINDDYKFYKIEPKLIQEVQLPNNLENIGKYTFESCENLKKINLPDGLKVIGDSAFDCCSSLVLDKLPDSIEAIDEKAFSYCEGLSIKELPKELKIINKKTFTNTKVNELIIHEGIEQINEEAFFGCEFLSKITFEGLKAPTIADGAFDEIASKGDIYYFEGAEGYSDVFKNFQGWMIHAVSKPIPPVSDGGSYSHSHYYRKEWKKDEVNHWHECSCGKERDVEEHEFTEWIMLDTKHRERKCLICGYIQKETFLQKKLIDAKTGIQLSGIMSENAKLVVSEGLSHASGLCNICDEIKVFGDDEKLIKAFEIKVDGDTQGDLIVSFPIDPQYNGDNFIIYHHSEGKREDITVEVIDGRMEAKVSALSDFAIIKISETTKKQVSLNQGESITVHPASMEGIWAYDDELIHITQNGDSFTLTAINEGSTSAVYTTKSTQTIVDVNIPASHVPNTNDSIRGYMLIAIVSLCGLVMIKMNQRKID